MLLEPSPKTLSEQLSRRSFLRFGVAGAFAGALTLRAGAAEAMRALSASDAASPIRLGLASYTFRKFPRAQMIGFLQQLQLRDLNTKDVLDHLPFDAQEESKALADYATAGIALHAAGVISFAKDEDADMRGKFEYATRAGLRVIVAGDPAPETLPRVEKFAKEYDMRIAIHNHGPEDKLWKSPLDVLKYVGKMDPRMGCCIDVGHTVRAGTDVVDAIHAAGPRLFNVHMKDLTDFNNRDSQVAVGDGKMPVREIFAALTTINYPGYVDLEYEVHEDDPMPGVTRSFAYMRTVLAGRDHAIAAARLDENSLDQST
jgi:sugar phosphate isomerase/epimerase